MAQTINNNSNSVNKVKLEGSASCFLAPEYLLGLKNGVEHMTLNMEKCDIFSLGMVMLKAYCGLTDYEL